MRLTIALPLLSLIALAACTGAPPTPQQRLSAQDELNQSGQPYVGPHGTLASAPPADSSFVPLRCHLEGPGQVCDRSGN